MHCVVHHGRLPQDEAFEVSGDGEQGGLEVCLALRQGIRGRLRVVHGVAEVGEQRAPWKGAFFWRVRTPRNSCRHADNRIMPRLQPKALNAPAFLLALSA